jgi:hypothetical protein
MQVRTTSFGPVLTGLIATGDTTFRGTGASAEGSAGEDVDGNSYDITLTHPGSVGTLHINIPASTPTDIVGGTWITVAAPVENWRFGIYVVHTIRVQVPL